RRDGAIVVIPDSRGAWHGNGITYSFLGIHAEDDPTNRAGSVAFVESAIAKAKNLFGSSIDDNRMYLTSYAHGTLIGYRMAADYDAAHPNSPTRAAFMAAGGLPFNGDIPTGQLLPGTKLIQYIPNKLDWDHLTYWANGTTPITDYSAWLTGPKQCTTG